MAGVHRRITVSKDSLLGPVAEYYTDDYVVWAHDGEQDVEKLCAHWPRARDVMLHRFVLISDKAECSARTRSFLLGLGGYLEVYRYGIARRKDRRIRDLALLVDRAWEIARETPAAGMGARWAAPVSPAEAAGD